ncbi:MAG: hypothetical protein ACXADC_18325 [Candidatus Thorarchaeota archaeon]|jgi:hypothetical protein
MDQLLMKARALYKDREKIAFSALLIAGTVAFYLFYSSGIIGLTPPDWFPRGWTQGFEVVASLNTMGFFLAFALMVFAYSFWSWAFLPSPAAIYTRGVLRGILGSNVIIKQSIGKRFKVIFEDGRYINVSCRIKEPGGGWFLYRLASSKMSGNRLDSIALRHGMSLQDGHFTSSVTSDELHHRTLLLAKAMNLVSTN